MNKTTALLEADYMAQVADIEMQSNSDDDTWSMLKRTKGENAEGFAAFRIARIPAFLRSKL